MLILAIDLGTTSRAITKSAITLLDTESGDVARTVIPTTPESLLSLLRTHAPHRVVLEMTRGTGWVVDLLRGYGIRELEVVNTRDPAWLNRPSKTDRRDADLLARLSATGMLRTVHVPERHVREWRELIAHRHVLIRDRTRIKNRIRALLGQHGIATAQAWTQRGLASLGALAKPLPICDADELWRGSLLLELARLREIERHLAAITSRLDRLVTASAGAALVRGEIDGVGPRTAEAITAFIDDPLRFPNQKALGGFTGLAPRVSQSGSNLRHGSITKQGPPLLRAMLTEAVWLGIRRPGRIRTIYDGILRKDPTRQRTAITATARRLAVILWAKLRDHRRAQPDTVTLPIAA
jgi:transposase